MSFMAHGSGCFDIVTENVEEFIAKNGGADLASAINSIAIEELGRYIINATLETVGGDEPYIDIRHDRVDYSEEAEERFFKRVAPVLEGEMDFNGEDDTHWRFTLEGGDVKYEDGEVYFEDGLKKESYKILYEATNTKRDPGKPENKQYILDLLLLSLRETSNLFDLVSLTYDEEKESVKATFDNGHCKVANVAADSGTAMIRDVIKQIV